MPVRSFAIVFWLSMVAVLVGARDRSAISATVAELVARSADIEQLTSRAANDFFRENALSVDAYQLVWSMYELLLAREKLSWTRAILPAIERDVSQIDSLTRQLDEFTPRALSLIHELSEEHRAAVVALAPLLRPAELFALGLNALFESRKPDNVAALRHASARLSLFWMETHETRLVEALRQADGLRSFQPQLSASEMERVSASLSDADAEVFFRFGPGLIPTSPEHYDAFYAREQFSYLESAASALGDVPRALAAARAYLRFAPGDVDAQSTAATLEAQLNSDDQAQLAAESAERRTPNILMGCAGVGRDAVQSDGGSGCSGAGADDEAEPASSTSGESSCTISALECKAIHEASVSVASAMVQRSRALGHVRVLQQALDKLVAQADCAGDAARCPALPAAKPVARESEARLSYADFFARYAVPRVPVLIEGGVRRMTTVPWTLQHIHSKCGNRTAHIVRWEPTSDGWASLASAGSMNVGEFIDAVDRGDYANVPTSDKRYLFDWLLPYNCPELLDTFVVPAYFAGDLMQRTVRGWHVPHRDDWPSLFIGPAGSRSSMHVDAFASSFWMGLVSGVKRWLIYPNASDVLPFLHVDPRVPQFGFDPLRAQPLDSRRFPSLLRAQPIEVIQRAGDIVFIPGGTPHAVENLEDIIGVSMNYVDAANVDSALAELRQSALAGDASYAALLEALDDASVPYAMLRDQRDLPFAEFKRWPRPAEHEASFVLGSSDPARRSPAPAPAPHADASSGSLADRPITLYERIFPEDLASVLQATARLDCLRPFASDFVTRAFRARPPSSVDVVPDAFWLAHPALGGGGSDGRSDGGDGGGGEQSEFEVATADGKELVLQRAIAVLTQLAGLTVGEVGGATVRIVHTGVQADDRDVTLASGGARLISRACTSTGWLACITLFLRPSAAELSSVAVMRPGASAGVRIVSQSDICAGRASGLPTTLVPHFVPGAADRVLMLAPSTLLVGFANASMNAEAARALTCDPLAIEVQLRRFAPNWAPRLNLAALRADASVWDLISRPAPARDAETSAADMQTRFPVALRPGEIPSHETVDERLELVDDERTGLAARSHVIVPRLREASKLHGVFGALDFKAGDVLDCTA